MKRRIFALCLCVAMLVTMMPITAIAADQNLSGTVYTKASALGTGDFVITAEGTKLGDLITSGTNPTTGTLWKLVGSGSNYKFVDGDGYYLAEGTGSSPKLSVTTTSNSGKEYTFSNQENGAWKIYFLDGNRNYFFTASGTGSRTSSSGSSTTRLNNTTAVYLFDKDGKPVTSLSNGLEVYIASGTDNGSTALRRKSTTDLEGGKIYWKEMQATFALNSTPVSAGTEVTVSDDKNTLLTAPTDAILWTASATTGTRFQLRNQAVNGNNNYLQYSSNQLRLNSSGNYSYWTYSGTELNYAQTNNGSRSGRLTYTNGAFARISTNGTAAAITLYKKTAISATVKDTEAEYTGSKIKPEIVTENDLSALTVKYSTDGTNWYTAEDASFLPVEVGASADVYTAVYTGSALVAKTSATVHISVTMQKVTPPERLPNVRYTGTQVTAKVPEGALYKVTACDPQIAPGTYTATVGLKDTTHYCWDDGTTDDISVPWKITAADPEKLTGSVYMMDNLDNMDDEQTINAIVTAHHVVPNTKANLWFFAPKGSATTNNTTTFTSTGKLFTKISEGVYYYLGVEDGKLVAISSNTEAESHNNHMTSSSAPAGAADFTISVNKSTGAATVKSGDYYLGYDGSLSEASTTVYLRGNDGCVNTTTFDGNSLDAADQRSYYITDAATPTKALQLKSSAFTTASFDASNTVDTYFGMPENPDEIALPLTFVNDVVTNRGNAAVWFMEGSKTNFTLTLVKDGETDKTKKVASETNNGYHNYRLGTSSSGTEWQFVAASGAAAKNAIKLSSSATGNGFTFNKHDTNRFGYGNTSNTVEYCSISLYKQTTVETDVTDVLSECIGSVVLPEVEAITSVDGANLDDFTVKYSMDGIDWYSEDEALAADDVFPVEGSETPYNVMVGLFFVADDQSGLMSSKNAKVTILTEPITPPGYEFTYPDELTDKNAYSEDTLSGLAEGCKITLDLDDGAYNSTDKSAMTGDGWTEVVSGDGDYTIAMAADVDISDYIPVKNGFVFTGFEIDEDSTDNNYLLVAQWETDTVGPDGNGDGIPDKYQIVITFKIEGGEWTDDPTGADKKIVLTRTNNEGKWSENGFAALEAGDIPTAAAKNGYFGGWQPSEPTTTDMYNESSVFTYSYTKKPVHYLIASEKHCSRDETCPIESFPDTLNDYWWHDGIHFCVENKFMIGVPSGDFEPYGDITRAQFVCILWRLEGSPENDYPMSFRDVHDGDWYTEAIRWAQSTGVVKGYSAEEFGPNDPITREQLAAILCRYAAFKGVDTADYIRKADLSVFDDADTVSDWAVEGVKFSVAAEILKGANGKLNPRKLASRAEAACMILRYCEAILVDKVKYVSNYH